MYNDKVMSRKEIQQNRRVVDLEQLQNETGMFQVYMKSRTQFWEENNNVFGSKRQPTFTQTRYEQQLDNLLSKISHNRSRSKSLMRIDYKECDKDLVFTSEQIKLLMEAKERDI